MTTIQILICINCYMMFKTVLWWLLFGTGKLIFRKMTLREWGTKTLWGIFIIAIVAGLDFLFGYYPPEETDTLNMMLLPFLVASFWIAIRETTSICGLLAGDWNPFHPKLRFFSFMFIVNFLKNRPVEKEGTLKWHGFHDDWAYYDALSRNNNQ